MEPTLYSSLSATAHNAPSAPTRTTLPGNASSQVRYDKDNHYRKELDTYENHIAMDNVMKKQIQDAVEDVYIRQLQHKYSAYLGVWYIQIKPANLVANGENYNKPTDISQPINVYFARIDDCIQYASDGKTPCTSKQIITT
eukprot:7874901-Ditylum_brightwellii.AAC.1